MESTKVKEEFERISMVCERVEKEVKQNNVRVEKVVERVVGERLKEAESLGRERVEKTRNEMNMEMMKVMDDVEVAKQKWVSSCVRVRQETKGWLEEEAGRLVGERLEKVRNEMKA